MVEFGSGYYMPMDREYGAARIEDTSTNDIGVAPIRDIGFSVPLGIAAPNVQGVAAKIRTGTRIMELQFPGAGRAQRGAQTPGIYGHLQRQALEEISRANTDAVPPRSNEMIPCGITFPGVSCIFGHQNTILIEVLSSTSPCVRYMMPGAFRNNCSGGNGLMRPVIVAC